VDHKVESRSAQNGSSDRLSRTHLFIIGFSVAKNHMAVAPERAGILYFSVEIVQAGYEHTKDLIRFPWISRLITRYLRK
jgi:uncharacterized protein YdhG (YjbR/CyaY superfamily)